MGTYVVIANQTTDSPELAESLQETAKRDRDAEFVLLVPSTPIQDLVRPTDHDSQTAAEQAATQALYKLNDAGIRFWRIAVCDSSPLVALEKELRNHPGRLYSGLIISTLPIEQSHWQQSNLPARIAKTFGLPITHIVGWGGGLDNGYE
jgi:hypothetical protein